MVHAEKDSTAKNGLKIGISMLQTNKCCKFLQDVKGRRRPFSTGEQAEPKTKNQEDVSPDGDYRFNAQKPFLASRAYKYGINSANRNSEW